MHAVESTTTPQRQSASGVPPRSAPPGRYARRRRRATSGGFTPLLLAMPAIVIIAALLGYPLYRVIVLSFQDMELRHLFTGTAPPWIGLDNFTQILTDQVFWDVTRRTAIFTLVSVVLSVLAGLAIALLMRRVSRPVRMAMVIAMMFVWAVPQLVQAQIFKWMTDADFGVLN